MVTEVNFRECRQGVLLEMMQSLDQNITAKKSFLITGGMQNAYYIMPYHNLKLWGLCGCGEVNVPGVFEIFDIPFKIIKAKDFWNTYKEDKEKSNKSYILPMVRSVLNTSEANLDNYTLVGHSYFTVDNIENDRLYFRTVNQNTMEFKNNEYYLEHDIYDHMNNKSEWIKESEFEGYIVIKSDLKKSRVLNDLLKNSEKKLLEMNIK